MALKLLIASQNRGKKNELLKLLSQTEVECVIPTDLVGTKLIFPEETGTTFAENALLKAQALHDQTGLSTLADDSGLSVASLYNFPGVQSARWMEGSDADRSAGLLKKLRDLSDRSAYFTCVLCLIENGTPPRYFEGSVKGTISSEPRGDSGFGYDPIFIPDGQIKTFAELGTDYKNSHSHRAIALAKLRVYLEEKYAKL